MLEIDQLKKSYGNDIVLEDVSLSVRPKERVALVGRNGTKKLTLLRIVAGGLEPGSGRVSVAKGGASPICPRIVVASDRPLHEEVLSVFAEVLALEERQRDLEARMRRMAPNGPELSRSTTTRSSPSSRGAMASPWKRRLARCLAASGSVRPTTGARSRSTAAAGRCGSRWRSCCCRRRTSFS